MLGVTLLILRVQMYKNIRFHTRKGFLISMAESLFKFSRAFFQEEYLYRARQGSIEALTSCKKTQKAILSQNK